MSSLSNPASMPDSARRVWREGFRPLLSADALSGLHDALARDDAVLIQGDTVRNDSGEWAPERACPIAYTGIVEGLENVGEVTEYFCRLCHECDKAMGEPAAVRWFLNWWDCTPRAEAVLALLAEIEQPADAAA